MEGARWTRSKDRPRPAKSGSMSDGGCSLSSLSSWFKVTLDPHATLNGMQFWGKGGNKCQEVIRKVGGIRLDGPQHEFHLDLFHLYDLRLDTPNRLIFVLASHHALLNHGYARRWRHQCSSGPGLHDVFRPVSPHYPLSKMPSLANPLLIPSDGTRQFSHPKP